MSQRHAKPQAGHEHPPRQRQRLVEIGGRARMIRQRHPHRAQLVQPPPPRLARVGTMRQLQVLDRPGGFAALEMACGQKLQRLQVAGLAVQHAGEGLFRQRLVAAAQRESRPLSEIRRQARLPLCHRELQPSRFLPVAR
ncbi:hypothetical protein AB7878_11390 [Rhodanobacter humi]|uniref:Uncharacterized protein n=1 Tax=Rhodanobacter humi TaxID=1888173 RepID=A0ABV4ARI8_9GAMM